jgi:hypothetical protein
MEFSVHTTSKTILESRTPLILSDLDYLTVISLPKTLKNTDFLQFGERIEKKWVTLDIACGLYGIIFLPMFETLDHSGIQFVFERTDVENIVVNQDKVDGLIKSK